MPTLIAQESYPYAGRTLAKGDRFDASDKDAILLKMIGRAMDAPPDPPRKSRQTYRRRDMVSQSAAVTFAADLAQPSDPEDE